MGLLRGLGVSAGHATGPVVRVPERIFEPDAARTDTPKVEAARIRVAMRAVAARLSERASGSDPTTADVLHATAAMAEDPVLADEAESYVLRNHVTASRAVWESAAVFSRQMAAGGERLAARVRDVEDVRDRIIAELEGGSGIELPQADGPVVLVARDLAPADTASLRPDAVAALVTSAGGPTSHTAILARALGIPAVVACPEAATLEDGAYVVVDGAAGTVETVETGADRAATSGAPARTSGRNQIVGAVTGSGPGRTADGVLVPLLANVADATQARRAADAGAQGVGLFRTEVLFLGCAAEPSVQDQRAAYAEVFRAFPGRPVVVRTLDAGADKPVPFLSAPPETNPALGLRGQRLTSKHPDVLARQLEALALAATDAQAEVSVMAPMVAVPAEARSFATQARAAGLARVGVMVEVPSAALTAAGVLAEVDFASVGTNDLAQYTLAADRAASSLATLNDPWQPSVLRLVELTAVAGRNAGKPVGVCGEAAADPELAMVLVGLGVTSLSMVASALAGVRTLLARTTLDGCRRAAALATAAPSAEEGRSAVCAFLA